MTEAKTAVRRGLGERFGELLLKLLAFFVILEPIWMLLPFAGFLYGSGLHIQTLARHPETAWLTHFVFPILTLGPVGPIMVLLGAIVFVIGASQIYTAKWRRTGMVSKWIYKFVRHPQYTSLTLLGAGLLLTWGRAIMFIFFFLMMFLYYYLAKKEEAICVGLFGEEYERYRERTPFCIPGGKGLDRLLGRVPALPFRRWLSILVSFVITVLVMLGVMWLIKTVRIRVREVPHLAAKVSFSTPEESPGTGPELWQGRANGVPFARTEKMLVVRGPWRSASAPGFAESVIRRLPDSPSMAEFLSPIEENEREAAVVFCAPFTPQQRDSEGPGERFLPKDSKRRGPAPDPHGPDRVRLILMHCKLAEGATLTDAVRDQSKRRVLAMAVAKIDLGKDAGEDIVVDGPHGTGPANPGEERWAYLMGRLAEREALLPRPDEAEQRVAAPSDSGELILAKAPMLRTRLYPPWAEDILNRLVESPSFRDRLQKCGVGGDLVAVAFPRPGPNWYQTYHFHYESDEHESDGHASDDPFHMDTHGRDHPQVSVFVMLVRRGSGLADYDALFKESRRSERQLVGAFIAELDFGIEAPNDKVHQIVVVGPRRDLEERWTFFLSGL